MAQPYAFALSNQQIVLKATLDSYALKQDDYDFDGDMFKEKASKGDSQLAESSQVREGDTLYSAYNLMEPPYPPKMLAMLAEMNTYHSSAVKTKAVDAGGLGVKVVPIVDDPSKDQKEKLEEFINNCFPTFEDVATRAFQDEEEIGWLCIELIRVAGLPTGEPQRLEHIPSHTIRIHKDGNRFMQTWDGFNNRWFKLIGDYRSVEDREDKDIDKKDGSEHPLNSLDKNNVAHEMIYDINYSSRSSYYGTPDSVPAIRTMIGDQSAVNYNISFFKNFAIPAYAIYITGYFEDEPELDDDDEPTGKTVLQVAMEEKFQSVLENPHGSLVFMIPTADPSTRVEIRFEKLTVDTKESSFRLYRMDNRDEVISAHRVDPYRAMVMQTGSLGGNTAIESKKNYKSTTIKPKQRRFEALININVIWEESPKGLGITDYAIQLEELDTEDEAHEMAMDQALFMMGAIRPIDIIKKWEHKTGIPVPENLDKDPALNAYYINNVPVTSSEKGEQPPQTTAMPEEVAKILDDIANKIEEQNGYS